MTTKKAVTSDQGVQVAKMARDKGVGRDLFQEKLLDSGTMAHILDAIKNGQPITIGAPLVLPPGARVHTLKVAVNYDRDWQEAINAGGPDTPADWKVRRVAYNYQCRPSGVWEEEIILLHIPEAGLFFWTKANFWAEQFGFERTNPWEVLAIGEHFPNLHRELKMDSMEVIATKESSFKGVDSTCSVCWNAKFFGSTFPGDSRQVNFGGLGCFSARGSWSAFRRKVRSQTLSAVS